MTPDERFDRIDDSIARLESNLARLTNYVVEFRSETIQRFELIDQRMHILSNAITNLDSRVPAMSKAILDFGESSSQLQREQWRARDANAELASRVDRIEAKLSKLIDPAA